MGIGSLGFSEMLVIGIIVLIAFGPRRLPGIGRSLGRAMREFRRSLNEIQREFEEAERMTNPTTATRPRVTEPPMFDATRASPAGGVPAAGAESAGGEAGAGEGATGRDPDRSPG